MDSLVPAGNNLYECTVCGWHGTPNRTGGRRVFTGRYDDISRGPIYRIEGERTVSLRCPRSGCPSHRLQAA